VGPLQQRRSADREDIVLHQGLDLEARVLAAPVADAAIDILERQVDHPILGLQVHRDVRMGLLEAMQPRPAAKVLAEFLEVTERRVRQLVDEGIAVKAARDRYRLRASVQAYCRYLKNLRDGTEDKKSEETRLTKARAESYEFELSVKRREFYPASEVDQALLTAATTLTSMLDGASARIASQLGGGGTLRRRLIDEFREVRKQFAEALRRFSTSLQSDGWDRRAAPRARTRQVGKKKARASAGKR